MTEAELELLQWFQDEDPDRVVVPPNMLRHSRFNSDERYLAAQVVLAQLGITTGRLLDIGCGISAQADMFRAYQYVGADVNQPRLCRGLTKHAWARYAAQDIGRMGWRDGTFDAILCLEVIEHLPISARPALMHELFRVLGPAGAVVLSTPNGRIGGWKRLLGRKCERSHEPELPPEEVDHLARTAGARIIREGALKNLILPAGRLGGGVVHLVADRPRLRGWVQRVAAAAGYETRLYVLARLDAPQDKTASAGRAGHRGG